VGFVVEVSRGGEVYIAAVGEVYVGDLLYSPTRGGASLLVVEGFEGEVRAAAEMLRASAEGEAEVPPAEVLYIARPLLTVLEGGAASYPVPPLAGSPAYHAPGEVLQGVGRALSSGPTPIAWLRSGTVVGGAARERYYHRAAAVSIDLGRAASGHVLVTGQTGSGKSSSVMLWIASHAAHAADSTTFVVFDRHGEYSSPGFLGALDTALARGPAMAKAAAVYRVRAGPLAEARAGAYVREVSGRVNASSVSASDFVNSLDDPELRAEDVEAGARAALSLASQAVCQQGQRGTPCVPEALANLLGAASESPTLGAVLLLLLLHRNVLEAERRNRRLDQQESATLYASAFRSEGVYVSALRRLSVHVASSLGLWLRQVGGVYVVEDRYSPVAAPEAFKDPAQVSCVLTAIYRAALGDSSGRWEVEYDYRGGRVVFTSGERVEVVRAPWLAEECEVTGAWEAGFPLEEVYRAAGRQVVVVALNEVSNTFADMVASAVARGLLWERVSMGVQQASAAPPVALVSEEAPLYLGPDRVRSPLNPFARVAREGRKFRVGLVAVTQLATRIERNILDNFNTVVAFRTTSRSDLSWLEELSFPAQTMPRLGLREGYIVSSELPVRVAVPIYVPAYYDPSESPIAQRPGQAGAGGPRGRHPLRHGGQP